MMVDNDYEKCGFYAIYAERNICDSGSLPVLDKSWEEFAELQVVDGMPLVEGTALFGCSVQLN